MFKIDNYHDRMLKELGNIENGCYKDIYNNDKVIYERLRNYYLDKIKEPDFNISVEKIRIEKRLGIYNGFSIIYSINLYIAIYCVFISIFINFLLLKINSISINVIAVIIIFLPILYFICKDITMEKPKNILNFIALKVLDDIEKDMVKNYLNAVETTKEVAAANDNMLTKKSKKKKKK